MYNIIVRHLEALLFWRRCRKSFCQVHYIYCNVVFVNYEIKLWKTRKRSMLWSLNKVKLKIRRIWVCNNIGRNFATINGIHYCDICFIYIIIECPPGPPDFSPCIYFRLAILTLFQSLLSRLMIWRAPFREKSRQFLSLCSAESGKDSENASILRGQ